MIDLPEGAKPYTWNQERLLRYMTLGENPILDDPILLNAFRSIKREHFLPEDEHPNAYTDRHIPIGYDQYSPSPLQIAKQLKFLGPKYGGKYLHIGSGLGYTAALLAFIAGNTGSVHSLERIQWLWEQSRKRIREYYPHLENLVFLYRDGLEGLVDSGPYDGILLSFNLPSHPDKLLDQLNIGGKLLYPSPDQNFRLVQRTDSDELIEEILPDINTIPYGKSFSGIS